MVRTALYGFSRDVSASAGLESPAFLDSKILLLESGNLLSGAIDKLRGMGTTKQTAAAVLHYIGARTIPYNKLIEYITIDEIVEGKIAVGVEAVECSRRTVIRCLHVLEEVGLIVRVVTNYGKSVFYGLNLPFILSKLKERWKDAPVKEGTSMSVQLERLNALLAICNRLHGWYDKIKNLVGNTIRELAAAFKSLKLAGGKVMGDLKQNLPAAVGRAKAAALKTVTKSRGGQLYFQKNGAVKGYGKYGMAHWHQMAANHRDRYPGYCPKSTGKLRGMMSNLLTEWYQAFDFTDHEAKRRIEEIIETWWRIAGRSFVTYDRNVGRMVPQAPDFEFYFIHRREMDDLVNRFVESPESRNRVRVPFNQEVPTEI